MNKYLDFLASFGLEAAHPGGVRLTNEILKKMNPSQDNHVLEVGCGTGLTAAYMNQEYGCHITAIDKHPNMIKQAKQRFETEKLPIKLLQASAEQLPFDDDTFDFILVESVTVFTDIEKTLAEFYRVLKPAGTLYDIELTIEDSLNMVEREEIQQFYHLKYVPTEQDWINFFTTATFTQVETMHDIDRRETDTLIDITDMSFSDEIDFEAFETWFNHQMIKEKYKEQLNYRVFKVCK